jgi:hypothetical protein
MQIRKSNLPQHPNVAFNVIKKNFHGRGEGTYSEAVKRRPTIIRESRDELLTQLEAPGINIYKKVEMCDKYKRLLPDKYMVDVLYSDVSSEEREAVKKEKEMRKNARVEIKDVKNKAAQQVKRKLNLELDQTEQSPKKKDRYL